MESYRKLEVWQRSMELLAETYRLARRLPAEKRFALCDQLRRAAVSIPANIAEGQARQHRREFIQALTVARGSLAEVDTLLRATVVIGYFAVNDIDAALALALSVRQLLQRLIYYLKSDRGAQRRIGQR